MGNQVCICSTDQRGLDDGIIKNKRDLDKNLQRLSTLNQDGRNSEEKNLYNMTEEMQLTPQKEGVKVGLEFDEKIYSTGSTDRQEEKNLLGSLMDSSSDSSHESDNEESSSEESPLTSLGSREWTGQYMAPDEKPFKFKFTWLLIKANGRCRGHGFTEQQHQFKLIGKIKRTGERFVGRMKFQMGNTNKWKSCLFL